MTQPAHRHGVHQGLDRHGRRESEKADPDRELDDPDQVAALRSQEFPESGLRGRVVAVIGAGGMQGCRRRDDDPVPRAIDIGPEASGEAIEALPRIGRGVGIHAGTFQRATDRPPNERAGARRSGAGVLESDRGSFFAGEVRYFAQRQPHRPHGEAAIGGARHESLDAVERFPDALAAEVVLAGCPDAETLDHQVQDPVESGQGAARGLGDVVLERGHDSGVLGAGGKKISAGSAAARSASTSRRRRNDSPPGGATGGPS